MFDPFLIKKGVMNYIITFTKKKHQASMAQEKKKNSNTFKNFILPFLKSIFELIGFFLLFYDL